MLLNITKFFFSTIVVIQLDYLFSTKPDAKDFGVGVRGDHSVQIISDKFSISPFFLQSANPKGLWAHKK